MLIAHSVVKVRSPGKKTSFPENAPPKAGLSQGQNHIFAKRFLHCFSYIYLE